MPRGDIERASRRAAGPGRSRGAQGQVPRAALGRRAAAHRAGPRPGALARAAAAGRAALRARRARAPEPPPRDRRAAAAARRHHHHGHPRPGGGPRHGRPHRGDEPRGGGAGGNAGRDVHAAALAVRGALRGPDELLDAIAGERRAGRGSARWRCATGRAGRSVAGTRLTLAIRPEEILVGPAADGTENRLVTRIRSVQFLGAVHPAGPGAPRRGAPRSSATWPRPRSPALGAAEGAELPLVAAGPTRCGCSGRRPPDDGVGRTSRASPPIPDRTGPPPARRRGPGPLRLVALFAACSSTSSCSDPMRRCSGGACSTTTAPSSGSANYRRYFGTPAIARVDLNSLSVSLIAMVDHRGPGLRLRLRADAHADAGSRRLPPRGHAAALRALPGAGARLHLRLRQQRDLHPPDRHQRGHLRGQGHRAGRGLLLLPPRDAHPGGRALAPPTRASTTRPAASAPPGSRPS